MKRILIVDDEVGYLLAAKRLLQSPAVHVDSAATLEDALTLLNEQAYDVVITDIRLTTAVREEGLEILKYVKRRSPSTRVIIITGYGRPDMLKKAGILGADRYFEKPCSPSALKTTLLCWGVTRWEE